MVRVNNRSQKASTKWLLATLVVLYGLLATSLVHAARFNVNVVDQDGNPVTGFRWLLEEDTTWDTQPGVHTTDTLALGFHTSHTPVLQKGETTGSNVLITNVPRGGVNKYPNGRRYYVSVLPNSGYTMGGAPVRITTQGLQADPVTVVVSKNPLPTAQITVFIFEDNKPINNVPDLPEETGIDGTKHNFNIRLTEAAGQYGVAGGQVTVDAWGNPLGTEYAPGDPNTITKMGDGIIHIGADGVANIKNLLPAKYGVEVIPPANEDWHQTSTIEGTKTIDAWVKPNEPKYFVEFGPPGPHVFIGYVHTTNDTSVLTGGATITGQIVNQHNSRPPEFAFYNGHPFPNCWVGLNNMATGIGEGVYAQPCNADSTFSIPNVPPGSYQLVVWDDALDIVWGSMALTVNAGQTLLDLTEVPVFDWYSRYDTYVFYDANNNGMQDPGEVGMPDQTVNLRFRDGRIYQTSVTDTEGRYTFEEMFPFFNWLVAEVDYARFRPTGATITVDAGGPIDPTDPWSFEGVLNPQIQADTGLPYRTELSTPTAPVLLEGIQGFLGQTSVIQWGKGLYGPGKNGGITGIVFYSTTRAENDPRYAVGEPWEPGIPRVQVNLYQDVDRNGIIDDLNADGGPTLADVDNFPFGNFPAREDVDHNGNGVFDAGDAVSIVTSDSWDDNQPTGCQIPFIIDGVSKDCYDGLRNFNQIRPAVFDGGYGFFSYHPNGIDSGSAEVEGLPAGMYIVEAVTPPGYELVKEEDKNVELGDAYVPGTLALPAACVGDDHVVPQYLAMQTDPSGVPYPSVAAADLIDAPFAGTTHKLCDRKQVNLTNSQNAAADFFLFTQVPRAGHVVGMILNDLANEFDPNAPTFGEKYAPPFLPVSFRDWTGREINRVYADEWGTFNALVPSTYTISAPIPSGVSPNLVTACMNDAGAVPNPARATDPTAPAFITDPYYDPKYSQFCYTFQYMPGSTTYLDTPVLPVAAFAGPGNIPLDCEHATGTPLIYEVNGPGGGPYALPGEQITITSVGVRDVPNPDYTISNGQPKSIPRDYGFGTSGTVTIGGVPLTVVSWTASTITATIPPGTPTGELNITSGTVSSPVGVTFTVGPIAGNVQRVMPSSVPNAHPIQDAIDAASVGDLILVAPGAYDELVIMYKPVQLQGYGAFGTVINARKAPAEKLQYWRDRIAQLNTDGAFDLIPGQAAGLVAGGGDLEPTLFAAEEGAGITVVAKATGPNRFRPFPNARVDGFTVTGADHGGGIFVSGYANDLEISNNWVMGNQGTFGGGIRIGHTQVVDPATGTYSDASNNRIKIHNNHVAENGNLGGAGAGITLYTGSDRYAVTENFICGNFSQGNGAGIGHQGVSNNGLIADNTIVFNQSFNQGTTVNGGGVFIGGEPGIGAGTLSPGSGNVTIDGNLIQGNHAGAGDGGGIFTASVNGQDVANSPNAQGPWYGVDIFNNMIVNNVSGLAGAGISMQDTVKIRIINNTIANNDSTATAGNAFAAGSPNQSTPQPAGVVSRLHTSGLLAAIGTGVPARFQANFSNPVLVNDIIWHNRSFYFAVDGTTVPTTYSLLPVINPDGSGAVYDDLAVLPIGSGFLNPRFNILTDTTGYAANNIAGDPAFVSEYVNSGSGSTIQQQEFTTIQIAAAFDEGGNFIDVHYGPLSVIGDYHIQGTSPAIDAGNLVNAPELAVDYDRDPRPLGANADIGADEVQQTNILPAFLLRLLGISAAPSTGVAPQSSAVSGFLSLLGFTTASSSGAVPQSTGSTAGAGRGSKERSESDECEGRNRCK